MATKKQENKWIVPLIVIVVILIAGFFIVKSFSKKEVAQSPETEADEPAASQETSVCERRCNIVTDAGTPDYDLCVNTCNGF